MDGVPPIETMPSRLSLHSRSGSEPPASALLLKKGFARLEPSAQVELQSKNLEALSLSTNETTILMDGEGNLRDELGFLFGATSSRSSRHESQKSSDFDDSITGSTIPSNHRSQTLPRSGSIRTSGLQLSKSISISSKTFAEIQRRSWDDFQQQVGGSIHALTSPELQRWRKSSFTALKRWGGMNGTNLRTEVSTDRSEVTAGSQSEEPPRYSPTPEAQPKVLRESVKPRGLFSRLFRPRVKERKAEESVPSSPIIRLGRASSLKFRQPTKLRGKQLTQLLRNYGVPTELRAQVWIACTGAMDKKRQALSSDQYEAVLAQALQSPPPSAAQIELDLYRTFPTNYVYQQDEGIAGLRQVLLAYSVRNTVVGYCQSMNFIVATLLLHMSESEAFWVLAAIVEDLLPGYFSPELVGVHVDQRAFVALAALKFPRVTAHLERLQLPLALIVYQWFMCLFVNALPLGTTLRVWDSFLHEGSKVLFRVGLTIIKVLQKDILASETFQEAYEVLTEGTKNRERFSAPRLLRAAFDQLSFGSFSSRMLMEVRTRQLASVSQELGLDYSNDQPITQANVLETEEELKASDQIQNTASSSDAAVVNGSPLGKDLIQKTDSEKHISPRNRISASTLRRNRTAAELTADTFSWGFSPQPVRFYTSEIAEDPQNLFRRRSSTLKDDEKANGTPAGLKRSRAVSLDSPLRANVRASSFGVANTQLVEEEQPLKRSPLIAEHHEQDKNEEEVAPTPVTDAAHIGNSLNREEGASDDPTIWDSDEEDDDNFPSGEEGSGPGASRAGGGRPVELGPVVPLNGRENAQNRMNGDTKVSHGGEDVSLTDAETLAEERKSHDDDEEAEEDLQSQQIPTVDLPAEFSTRLRSLSFVMSARPMGSAVVTTAALQQTTLTQVPEEEMLDLHDILTRFDEIRMSNDGSVAPPKPSSPPPIDETVDDIQKIREKRMHISRRMWLLRQISCGGCFASPET